jgi:hypothetical protein
VTLHERAEVVARKRQEAGCFVLLTNVPTAGEMAQRAGEVLRASKEQHGVEQNFAFLQAPVMVNSLVLKKPERIEALGLVLLLALLRWRLVERTLRVHVETTGNPLMGVGQEDHPEAHSVHDDDQICGGDGTQSRGPTPPRTAVVRCPTGLSQRSRRACHFLYPAPKWMRE